MSKVILDTNVLIYGLDPRSGFHTAAASLLSHAAHTLFVPTKVISEYFAVCSKLGMAETDIWDFYEEVKKNALILYPDQRSLGYFEALIKKYQPRGNKVFDLEIVSVALANGIAEIATANLGDFHGVSEITIIPLSSKGI